jgi:hypothetical protein
MYQDEILAEVWRNRDDYVAEHHHDWAEIILDLKRRQAAPHCKLVDRRQKDTPVNGRVVR